MNAILGRLWAHADRLVETLTARKHGLIGMSALRLLVGTIILVDLAIHLPVGTACGARSRGTPWTRWPATSDWKSRCSGLVTPGSRSSWACWRSRSRRCSSSSAGAPVRHPVLWLLLWLCGRRRPALHRREWRAACPRAAARTALAARRTADPARHDEPVDDPAPATIGGPRAVLS